MVEIRPATADDAEAVAVIAQAAFQHYTARIGVPPVPMTVDYAATIAAGTTWVAANEQAVLGYVVLVDEGNHLLLDVVAVAPAAQGQGVGAALLRLAEAEARARGYSKVALYTNEAMTENLSYYPRHGYVETHRGTWNGFRRVYFTKQLEQ
jgi:ribosomal protein S18 acetylase RimI-like enzyme